MTKALSSLLLALLSAPLFTQCGSMGSITDAEEHAAIEARNMEIAHEPTGKFFYGRRYYIPYTRFWGYIREPRKRWSTAQMVMIDESSCKTPDRLPETQNRIKVPGENHGYDANYEYRLYGYYTGKKGYEPNTNQVLPVFRLTKYELINTNPGWLFTPREKYSEDEVSFQPYLIPEMLR